MQDKIERILDALREVQTAPQNVQNIMWDVQAASQNVQTALRDAQVASWGAQAVLRNKQVTPDKVMIIAIDGRCASGKTTLAKKLSEKTGAGVIHMDDFFLPMELRTRERLSEAGGNVDYERFAVEVLPYLKQGSEFTYRRFECSRMKTGENRVIPAGNLRIVEGAYSCHPRFGEYMTLRLFCDVSPQEQMNRIRERNGEEKLERFVKEWIPMEERYLNKYLIMEKADLVIKSGINCKEQN